jgi:hypothetical protein
MRVFDFLRCTVTAKINGKEYTKLATAGFDPLTIQPTVRDPADLQSFGTKQKQTSLSIPMDTRVTLLPERCTEKVNVYHVNLAKLSCGIKAVRNIMCAKKGS